MGSETCNRVWYRSLCFVGGVALGGGAVALAVGVPLGRSIAEFSAVRSVKGVPIAIQVDVVEGAHEGPRGQGGVAVSNGLDLPTSAIPGAIQGASVIVVPICGACGGGGADVRSVELEDVVDRRAVTVRKIGGPVLVKTSWKGVAYYCEDLDDGAEIGRYSGERQITVSKDGYHVETVRVDFQSDTRIRVALRRSELR